MTTQETNITGYLDKNNQPILVGQKLRDENGDVWDVVQLSDGLYGVAIDSIPSSFIEIGMFKTISEYVEIVVQEPEHNEAPVALAPFNGLQNLAKKINEIVALADSVAPDIIRVAKAMEGLPKPFSISGDHPVGNTIVHDSDVSIPINSRPKTKPTRKVKRRY